MTVHKVEVTLVFATTPSPIGASLVPSVNFYSVGSYLYETQEMLNLFVTGILKG